MGKLLNEFYNELLTDLLNELSNELLDELSVELFAEPSLGPSGISRDLSDSPLGKLSTYSLASS